MGYLTYRYACLSYNSPRSTALLSLFISLVSLSLHHFLTLYPSNYYANSYTRLSTN
jgi:hypothetical protein